MLNIVVPMAGRGSRFVEAGYDTPKPLIDIFGHPMIEYVTRNITPDSDYRFIYICQREHLERYDFERKLKKISPGCVVIAIDYITEGAACTVLLSEKYIDNEDMLMIANSDQFVDTDINRYLEKMRNKDGLIMTMPASDPKWSFISYEGNKVTAVQEKVVISDQATVGIYNYKQGSDFVRYAHQMINKNIRVNGEFYVAPVYNEMIGAGLNITFHDVGNAMYGMGLPKDLDAFMETDVCRGYFAEQECEEKE